MKKVFLIGAMVCTLGMMVACDKQKEECNLDGYFKTEWSRGAGVQIGMANAAIDLTDAPYAHVYEGSDVSTDNEPLGLYHYGKADDLCFIEKAPCSGWRDRVKLEEGHGYIFRHTEEDGTNRYCRFILKEWKRDASLKGIEDNADGPDTTIIGIHLLVDNEWSGD